MADPTEHRLAEPRRPGVRSDRLALGAFVAFATASWWVLVFDLGSGRWFYRDDWRFLAGRDGGSLSDVFRPHDVHPSAVSVVIFRLMYNAFGLWFTPYLMLIVTMHLGVAVLLRVVMRRAGVGPWVSSAAAGALVLFGPGEENIQWAFQINFVGAVLFGLIQLLLADQDGGSRRRDAAGVLTGVAAVLSSGIGPLMVAAVGLAVLARRGWRAALLHTAPPAVVYGVWVLVTHPRDAEFGRPPAVEVWNWIREGQVGTVEALGHFWIVGVLLGLLLVVGLVVLVTSTSVEELRHRGAVPLALLVCGPLFFALTAQGRWYFGAQVARSSRYLYIGAVLLLPALALAGDSLARRWRPVTGLVVLVLLVGVPGNFREFGSSIFNEGFFREQREVALGVPRTAEAEQVPEWVRPLPDQYNGEDLTIGWLLEARDAGRLPVPGDMNPRNVATFPIRVGLAFVDEPPVEDGCRTQTAPLDLSLVEGDRLAIRTSVNVATVADGKPTSRPVRFDPRPSGALSVEVSALDVRFTPVVPGGAFTVCY